MTYPQSSAIVQIVQGYTLCEHERVFSTYAANAARYTEPVEGLCPSCRLFAANQFGCYSFGRNRSAWRVR